jgi:hypothetical protein
MNGNVANYPPLVEIRTPSDGVDVSRGLAIASAVAIDYETGQRTPISWTLNGVSVGQSAYGANHTFNIPSTGRHRLTASASDPQGLVGSHTIVINVAPVPRDVRITTPLTDGQSFVAGLPAPILAGGCSVGRVQGGPVLPAGADRALHPTAS